MNMTTNVETLLDRARSLAAEVAERAREIDSASKLPDDLIAKFIDAELISLLVPRKYGGHELGLDTVSEVIQLFAAACPAVAWVLAFYIGHNWMHCQFPKQAQEEIFAHGPSPLSAGVLAPTFKLKAVAGGYRVSGRNSWNSGAPHAGWIMSGGIVVEGASVPGPLIFIVPRSEVKLIDTWDVVGMRATGSWDVELEDVFIPEHRTLSGAGFMGGQTPGSLLHENPFYNRPVVPISFSYSAAVFVGAARGVTDEFIRVSRTRLGSNDGKAANAKPTVQMRAGRGEARTQLAETLLKDLVASVMAPDAVTKFDVPARLALRARCAMLNELCKDIINDLVLGAGANAFRSQSRLQMIFRDINMISVHAFWEPESVSEGFGRILLGLEPAGPI
jgi:3-hydroxy-9,10-secoandrosta-1,3,5(10)-triene-9,17-dione monooxygenase